MSGAWNSSDVVVRATGCCGAAGGWPSFGLEPRLTRLRTGGSERVGSRGRRLLVRGGRLRRLGLGHLGRIVVGRVGIMKI